MCFEHGKLIWTRSAYFHTGPRHVKSRIKGRTHVSTRSHAAPSNKILLASAGASTHVAGGGEDGIDGVALVMPEVIAAHSMFGFEMADDRLDGGSPSQLASDLGCHPPLLA